MFILGNKRKLMTVNSPHIRQQPVQNRRDRDPALFKVSLRRKKTEIPLLHTCLWVGELKELPGEKKKINANTKHFSFLFNIIYILFRELLCILASQMPTAHL